MLLEVPNGELFVPIWPRAHTRWSEEAQTVSYLNGDGSITNARAGDYVVFGGSGSNPPDELPMPELPGPLPQWVHLPANGCHAPQTWMVGDMRLGAPTM